MTGDFKARATAVLPASAMALLEIAAAAGHETGRELFLVGGANGLLEGENHVRATPGTPMANVMLTLLQKLGVNDIESFGNSTGTFAI